MTATVSMALVLFGEVFLGSLLLEDVKTIDSLLYGVALRIAVVHVNPSFWYIESSLKNDIVSVKNITFLLYFSY